MYQNYLGIDISKADFVVALYGKKGTATFANTPSGFDAFYQAYQAALNNTLVVIETTGGYEHAVIQYLQQKAIAVHRANTRKVKHFIRSFGTLGKSDRIDAQGLARYGHERHPQLVCYQSRQTLEQQILNWVERRTALKRMRVQEKNRLKAPGCKHLTDSFKAVIAVLDAQIALADQTLDALIEQQTDFLDKQAVLETVHGIGKITALALVALLPELGQFNRRQIASLAGLAPHPYESGQKIGYRKTKGGRPSIKPVLFMAAMTAARSKSRLGAFYQKLIAAGKKKMVALTALMRKILVIANAKMKEFMAQNSFLAT